MFAKIEMQRVGLSGWRTGLANLLHKENRAWWGTRRWLVQSIVWAAVINGIIAALAFGLPLLNKVAGAPAASFPEPLELGVKGLFSMGGLLLAIGAIVVVHGSIIGERQLGVTEWLLSKPVSRPAYLLAKLLAQDLGVLVCLVGLPGAIAYGLLSLAAGGPVPPLPYLVGMAGLAVHTLFYVALTLMMGALTTSRGALLGVSLGTVLGGWLLWSIVGGYLGAFGMLTPWSLGDLLTAAVMTGVVGMPWPLPVPLWLPVGITALLSVIFVAVALARFERLEF